MKPIRRLNHDQRRARCMWMVHEWGMPMSQEEKQALYTALVRAADWGADDRGQEKHIPVEKDTPLPHSVVITVDNSSY